MYSWNSSAVDINPPKDLIEHCTIVCFYSLNLIPVTKDGLSDEIHEISGEESILDSHGMEDSSHPTLQFFSI